MTETLKRSDLAKIALAAWCNIPVEKLPAEKMWIEHPDDLSRQAWDRVINAVIEASRPTPTVEGGETQPVAWRWGCDRRDDGKPDHWTVCQTPRESRPPAPFSVAIVAEPLYSADALASRDAEIERLRGEVERKRHDPMIDRSEQEWDDLFDAISTVYSLKAGHTLTETDEAALRLVDSRRGEDEETATDAYHKGREEGLRERGGTELLELDARAEHNVCEAVAERLFHKLADDRAAKAEAERDRLSAALGEAERAAENLFAAYRARYATPATDRLRRNAPLTREMGELKLALSTIKTAREGNE